MFKGTSKDWASRVAQLKQLNVSGCVFYTDGGQRTNRGKPSGGYGIHAYFYNEDKPQKLGAFKVGKPTKLGYLATKEFPPVNVTHVMNVYGSSDNVSNNTAELDGFIQAASIYLESGMPEVFKDVIFLLDSNYVLQGINQYLEEWKKKGWRKSDGNLVKNLNYWKAIDALLIRLQEVGCNYQLKWVKGHVDEGNIQADRLATLGILTETNYADDWSELLEYIEPKIDLLPFFVDTKLLYYPNVPDKVGDYYYRFCFNSIDSQNELYDLGKNLLDTSISIVGSKKDCGFIDNVINKCRALDQVQGEYPKVVNLNLLAKPKLQIEFSETNIQHLPTVETGKDIKITTIDGKGNLITILNPPRNSYHTFKRLETLQEVYKDYTENDGQCFGIDELDITDLLFKTETSKKGVVTHKFQCGQQAAVNVNAQCRTNEETHKVKLALTFGLDLPKHRVFYNLKEHKPVVKLLTWCDNSFQCHFAVCIFIEDAFIITAAELSNSVIIGKL